jgi:outer membrane protein TolC
MNLRASLLLISGLGFGAGGCAHTAHRPADAESAGKVHQAAHRPPGFGHPGNLAATSLDPAPPPAELLGPQPVDAYIRRALAENRAVQAARYNVLAMKARIPQVTALDDPMLSNTIFPIPSVAPQYSLMGYNPYNFMLAQQFPWFGTLRLRGEVAEEEVKVALSELCSAQLDAVANVKRAYYDLYFAERAVGILGDNRKLATDFVASAKERYRTGRSPLQDVLRAEVVVTDIDRERERVGQSLAAARADLAKEIHVSPESDLRTIPEIPLASVPAEVERLYRLAVAARPELKGRLAAIARDERALELAKKRYYPNVTVGLSFMDMSKTNALSPQTANGSPNVGLFVGFNLPIYRAKLEAGVGEAEARALADAKLYDAERDNTYREVKDLLTQAKSQQNILGLFKGSILPKAKEALDLTATDYQGGTTDYVTLITAWREVLQIELQIAQVESDLGKSLASLERSVGAQINEHPPAPDHPEAAQPSPSLAPPVEASPFGPHADRRRTPATSNDGRSTPIEIPARVNGTR